ncbi:suppressor of fused domain protein [Chitinophaga arvensicola]|uniref:Suppressor of fused protein (SUFU) n=1 Tax=Chitinophaga arvensicola TaxID=29529 RepID=A0A1I0SDC9_9BACT|nr:suppressor of fused domain protein [Chitinophaga arvensicola]SEW55926.1 Suppressor of fused protein (SUFU) [Chitinophaga arvensicola]
MSEPVILIDQPNNRGTMYAIVEQDERVAYFYLYPSELLTTKYSPRPCWLRNLQPAPPQRDVAAMKEGMAPMLEAPYCNHPEGKAPLEAERITIVWMEEGDGAAVLYDNEILGVIPGWSLYNEEHAVAYAADCIDAADTDRLMPLGKRGVNAMYERVDQAIAFWKDWEDEASQAWSILQDQYIKAYEEMFGPLVQYYAIDGGQWPPMGLGKFEKDGVVYLLTLGVSIRPMPWVELLYNDRAPGFRRMELAMAVSKTDFTDKEIMAMAGLISGIADRPWKQVTWLGEGHTISAELPAPFESVIVSSALYNGAAVPIPTVYSDKVNLYWLSPITKLEREYAHSRPNAGYDLLERMIHHQLNHIVTQRQELPAD